VSTEAIHITMIWPEGAVADAELMSAQLGGYVSGPQVAFAPLGCPASPRLMR